MKPFSLALCAVTSLLAPIAAQGSIVPYLPKDTVVAIAMPDLQTSMNEFLQMPLAKMWAEKEVQAFVGDVKEMVEKQIHDQIAQLKEMHAQGAFPVDPEEILKLRVQGCTMAVTSLKLSPGERRPRIDIGLVLHLDFGNSAPTWNKLIRMGLGMMEAQAGAMMVKTETKIGDVELMTFSPPANEETSMSLNLAMVPNGIVIGSLTDEVRELVAAMNGKTPMLGAASHYQATSKQLAVDGTEMELFLRPDPAMEFVLGALRVADEMGDLGGVDVDGIDRAMKALGLRDLGSMGMTSNYIDGKCVSRMVDSSGAAAGATSAVKTVDMSFLKWVPKDAVSFSAGTMDVMSVYEALVRGLEAYDPEIAKQVTGQLAKMETQLGFTVRDDFFGAMGDHYIGWSMPMGTIASPPEMAVLVKVTDEAKLVKVLKNLAKLTNGVVEIEEGEKRGVMAYEVRVNLDGLEGMGGINPLEMFQPTFAFKNGYLVAGFSASDVKRVFQRMDREDDPKGDIRGNKEFAAIASSLPAGVTSIAFTDWKSNFESLYQVVTGLLAFVPMGDEVPIDMSLLPDAATLTKHLFASVSWSRPVAGGSETVTTSPFGPEVGIVAFAVIGGVAGVLAPRVARRGF